MRAKDFVQSILDQWQWQEFAALHQRGMGRTNWHCNTVCYDTSLISGV